MTDDASHLEEENFTWNNVNSILRIDEELGASLNCISWGIIKKVYFIYF